VTRVRPARPWASIPVSVLILFLWWVVAHNSGSGWVQFVGDVAFGTILIGLLGPALTVSRAKIRLVAAPADGNAGLPIVVELAASSRLRVRPIAPPGPEAMIGAVTGGRSDDDVTLLPLNRGVYRELSLELASAAPFGLQWWSRRLTVPLPTRLHVAPRRGRPISLAHLESRSEGNLAKPMVTEAGDPRGVRRYRPGDQRRRVHWPSTAHTGELMVREAEVPSVHPITLKVALPNDAAAADRLAERAMGTAIVLINRGSPFVLATDETQGTVVGPVDNVLEAGRRLARAIAAGKPAEIEAYG
jgi:uncharacterized protein (DUF58 family)